MLCNNKPRADYTNLMQTLNDKQLFFLIQFNLILDALGGKWCIEPLLKAFDTVENFRQDEIKQSP